MFTITYVQLPILIHPIEAFAEAKCGVGVGDTVWALPSSCAAVPNQV